MRDASTHLTCLPQDSPMTFPIASDPVKLTIYPRIQKEPSKLATKRRTRKRDELTRTRGSPITRSTIFPTSSFPN